MNSDHTAALPGRSRLAIRVGLLGLVVACCLTYLFVELYLLDGGLGFPLDDSWIHLEFARNLAAGEGLSYGQQILVTGSTAPLWTAMLSLLFWLPGSVVLWAKLLGILTQVTTVAGVYRLGREFDLTPRLALAAAALTTLTSWLVWSALAAMEVGLFCSLATWGMVLLARERRDSTRLPLALPVFCLSILARPEGLLLVVLAILDQCSVVTREEGGLQLRLQRVRHGLHGLLVGALGIGPVVAFYCWVGGSPLPTTYVTKAGYGESGLPSSQFLDAVQGILYQSQPIATLLAPVGVLVLIGRLGGGKDRGLLPAAWLLALPVAYSILSGDRLLVGNFGRYFFILFPVLVLLAVVGWDQGTRHLPNRLRLGPLGIRWKLWVGILLIVPTLGALNRGLGLYTQSVLNVEDSDIAMARALARHLPPEATLAVNDIGALGFFLPNRLIDLAGIISPELHVYGQQAVAETGNYHNGVIEFIELSRPDYVVVFPDWFPWIDTNRYFTPLLRIDIPNNITMGGDELVLYATPWTRYPLTGLPAGEADRGQPSSGAPNSAEGELP